VYNTFLQQQKINPRLEKITIHLKEATWSDV